MYDGTLSDETEIENKIKKQRGCLKCKFETAPLGIVRFRREMAFFVTLSRTNVR